MKKLAVLVSGGGTNLQAIIVSLSQGKIINCQLSVVISNKPGVFALERAANAGIPCEVVSKKVHGDNFEQELISVLQRYDIDLVVLAGFMAILGMDFVDQFENRIINVHPALIPAFCGKGYYGLVPHEKALEYGVKITGATVHFVNHGADEGPIILQRSVPVKNGDTPEILQKRVMTQAEWVILPKAIDLFCRDRLKIKGRTVEILRRSGI